MGTCQCLQAQGRCRAPPEPRAAGEAVACGIGRPVVAAGHRHRMLLGEGLWFPQSGRARTWRVDGLRGWTPPDGQGRGRRPGSGSRPAPCRARPVPRPVSTGRAAGARGGCPPRQAARPATAWSCSTPILTPSSSLPATVSTRLSPAMAAAWRWGPHGPGPLDRLLKKSRWPRYGRNGRRRGGARVSAAALRARTSGEARRPLLPFPFGTGRFSALRAASSGSTTGAPEERAAAAGCPHGTRRSDKDRPEDAHPARGCPMAPTTRSLSGTLSWPLIGSPSSAAVKPAVARCRGIGRALATRPEPAAGRAQEGSADRRAVGDSRLRRLPAS
jgi:hypothetical protein